MKTETILRPGRCPSCSNFMNWTREWDNLWRCGGCGEIVPVGPKGSTREAVEEAIRKSKEICSRW